LTKHKAIFVIIDFILVKVVVIVRLCLNVASQSRVAPYFL